MNASRRVKTETTAQRPEGAEHGVASDREAGIPPSSERDHERDPI